MRDLTHENRGVVSCSELIGGWLRLNAGFMLWMRLLRNSNVVRVRII